MPSSTHPNLALKYGWTLGESGWHTDMDANLATLGAVVALSVKDRDLTAPPGSPSNGDRYIVATGGTGAWSGHDGKIVARINGTWVFYPPNVGWLTYIEDEQKLSVYKAGGWSAGVAI